MSTVAIDNARTSELLSAFLSEIQEAEPVNNIFTRNVTFDKLKKAGMKVVNGGRQIYGNIDRGTKSNNWV